MFFEKKRTGLNHQTDKRMTPKLEVISGGCLGTIFIVITFNQEVSSTCQMKSHSLHTRNIPHACILEKHESAGKSIEEIQKKDHEDLIAEKGFNSLSDYNLVHKVFPIPEAMQIPGAKAGVDKGWEKTKKNCRHGE